MYLSLVDDMDTSYATSFSELELPNPSTPMAYLPPDLAYQTMILIYIFVGSFAVLTWDVLDNISADLRTLFEHKISVPSIAYFVSRLTTWGFVMGSTVFATAPLGFCTSWEGSVDSLYPIAVSASSLLFFFRVRSFFYGNKLVVAFFAFMWLAVLGGTLTAVKGVAGRNIGTTKYCVDTDLKPYISAAAIVPLVNDTSIFLAISWKLMMNTHREQSFKEVLKILICGKSLLPFSKALLHDQQVYYLTTVTTNLLTLIMLYLHSISVVYRTIFTIPNIVVMNVMACRVFRNTKLGTGKRDGTPTNLILPLTFQRETTNVLSESQPPP